MKNYYDILGIDRKASQVEIRKAYKHMSKKYHPDKHNGSDFYTESFKNINEAHQVLANDFKKREYDFSLSNYEIIKVVQQNWVLEPEELVTKRKEFIRKQIIKAASIPGVLVIVLLGFLLLFNKEDNTMNLYASSTARNQKLMNSIKTENILNVNTTKKQIHEKKRSLPAMKIEMKPIFQGLGEMAIVSEEAVKRPDIKENFLLEKELNEDDMNEVLKEIDWQKNEQNNTKINCVKVLLTENSNIKNGFAIAGFFKKKGYTIAGRETVSKNISGIKVELENSFIAVTLGNL